ncbi:unnamed protein product [Chondrus crispus]|uniref:Uncharacterized protein n=1 Tax=Chondrus crispus TaxID=2769 RepID=R7Q5V5_CHOCR|nr:unnamed protein product [Chondrus crispus]CDF33907.1 unnamed protein product [Chondrus crispus]|eukprot:XP_005713726.1 unnamed protein product [Chondrus crispus]
MLVPASCARHRSPVPLVSTYACASILYVPDNDTCAHCGMWLPYVLPRSVCMIASEVSQNRTTLFTAARYGLTDFLF